MEDILEDVVKGHLLERKDSYICINPLFHIMSLGFFMAIGLSMGNTTVVMPVPQVDAILAAVGRYKVKWFLGVPALYRMILENDRLDYYDLSSLKPEPMYVGMPLKAGSALLWSLIALSL